MMSPQPVQCPLCDGEARVVTERHEITAGRRKVLVDDEYMRCDACDEAFYTPDQSEQLRLRAQDAVERQEHILPPDHIREIRESLGLSQSDFDRLLGVGEKSSARWETGRVRPNVATDRLIRLLAASRSNVRLLAAINGVALPEPKAAPAHAAPFAASEQDRWAGLPRAFRGGGIFGQLTGTHEEGALSGAEHKALLLAARQQLRMRPVAPSGARVPNVFGAVANSAAKPRSNHEYYS